MSILILLMALATWSTVGQGSARTSSPIDLSGSWRDDRARSWTIAQNGSEVTIADGEGLTFRGTLERSTVKYTEQIILGETPSPNCHPYVGQAFEFAAELKVSKDATKLTRKTPESVTKGQCTLNLKKMPKFALTKVASN